MKHKILAAIGLSLMFGCQQTSPIVTDLAKDELSVSMLSVNLRHVYNEPQARTGVAWRERYTRIANYIRDASDKPDVIVLQEAPGFFQGPGSSRIGDYAGIDFLIEKIRQATGEQYRIAYFVSDTEGTGEAGGWVEQLSTLGIQTRAGKALLYRSSKWRNAFANGTSTPALEYDVAGHTETHLTSSMPCCDPGSTSSSICSLIDGPMRTYKCNSPTPMGLAWTRRQDNGPRGSTDGVFARLELVRQPGNYIHIYNVHLAHRKVFKPDGSPEILPDGRQNTTAEPGANSIKTLINEMEQRFSSTGLPLYPPIVVGDFNIEGPHINLFFDQAFYSQNAFAQSPDVIGVLVGNPTRFRSKQTPYLVNPQLQPWPWCVQGTGNNPAALWSDHCSIAFRIQPAP